MANAVRFAFWGAEEEGLIGSTAYVQGLGEADRGPDRAVPEPGHGRLTQLRLLRLGRRRLGNGGSRPGPAGSAAMERVLVEALARPGCGRAAPASTATPTTGRSSRPASPSGGLFTGAARADVGRGLRSCGAVTPNAPHDPCYHQACDRIDTIDRVALDRNADATATVLARFALSTEGLP